MKRLLTLLGCVGILATTAITVVGCGNKIVPIKSIESEIEQMLNIQQNEAWNLQVLQNDIDQQYGQGIINVQLVNPSTRDFEIITHEDIYKFIANNNKYSGETTLSHRWNERVKSKPEISTIETNLQAILSKKINEEWNLSDLQIEVNKLDAPGGITVEEVEIYEDGKRAFEEQPRLNNFKFIGHGTVLNSFKYKGEIILAHQWEFIIDKTEDIKTIDKALKKIVNSKEEYWTKEELEQAIVDSKLDVKDGITVSEELVKKNNDVPVKKWIFQGRGDKTNDFKYKNSLELWQVKNKKTQNQTIYIDDENNEIKAIEATPPNKTKEVINIGWNKETKEAYQMPKTIEKVPIYISSEIKSLFQLFYSTKNFNDISLSNWNTENVTDMRAMFWNAPSFNQDLSKWNTSNVTNMSGMFASAMKFNGNITNWNTENVTNMNSMFSKAKEFNQDLSKWNTSNVTNMSGMFARATLFNRNLETVGNSWNTKNVTNMSGMFAHAISFNGNIANWDTSNVKRMENMFEDAKVFNNDITKWNTENVIDMDEMFSGASEFNQNLNKWNVANVWSLLNFSPNSKLQIDFLPKFSLI
ncbi:BspA family leucine-rich repeat surface protein [Williamsoniiplasma luminosum]|uniref:BspA family leucine-rich repeat surface protein n=1 Tax=Williamsoniiplasma luminosum TaxID=214888 RepID=A0A2S0NJM8_9MOLU|nr:BspA family leucine-rich repeat surface protein [Williamsoniiplasma luminosum]AVP49215.1 MAG: hypothetical protein C5T88_01290 [Williamsoniiplasma luminosum]